MKFLLLIFPLPYMNICIHIVSHLFLHILGAISKGAINECMVTYHWMEMEVV